MSILSQEFVFTAIEAEKTGNQFPIDFDDVWQAMGYSRKNNAVRKLKNHLEPQYFTIVRITGLYQSPPINKFYLSIDGFKHFCLLTKNPQGREVRQYFVDVEKAHRQVLERQFNQSSSSEIVDKLAELEKENDELTKALKKLIESNNRLLKNIADKKSNNIPCDKELTEHTQHSEELWQTSGISSYRYFKGACIEELEPDKDYKWLGDGHMMLTRHAAVKMLIILRSESGLILDRVPDAKVTIRDLVKKSDTKINRRSPQAN